MESKLSNDHLITAAFNRVSTGLAVINEQGFFTEVNETLCGILGYTKAEFLLQPSTFYFPGETQQEVSEFQHSLFEGQQSSNEKEWQVKTKSGALIDLSFIFDFFIHQNGQCFLIQTTKVVVAEKHQRQTDELARLKYQSLIDHSIHAFFLAKPDGSILEANKAAEKIFGYSQEELRRLGRKAIIDHADASLGEKIKERNDKGFSHGEITGIHKNGKKFPLEFSSFLFNDLNGELNTSTMLYDISERKKHEEELQRSKDEMASILNNTDEMFMIIDNEYRLINYNKAAKERAKAILGKELTIGDSLLSLAVPERHAYLTAVYNKVLAGETIRYKHTVDRGLGTEIYQLTYSPVFDADGICKQFMVTVRDVTVEENAVNEIIRNQQLLEQAESIANIGSWEYDLKNGGLTISNETFRILGYEPGSIDISLEKVLASVHPEDREKAIKKIQHAIASKQDYTIEKRLLRPDGSICFINAHAKFIKNSSGEVVKMVGIFHDVTAQKIAEQQKEFDRLDKEALINATSDLIWSVSKEYKLIAANKAFIQSLTDNYQVNIRPGDMVLIPDVFTKEHLNFWERVYTRALKGESFSIELHSPKISSQGDRWNEFTFNPIYNNNEVIGVACRGRDITQHKVYQQKLLKLNDQLENAKQIAKLGYWEIDLETDDLFLSKQAYQIFGFNEIDFEVSYDMLAHRIHPDDKAMFSEQRKKALTGEAVLNIEYRIILPDDTVKYILERGAHVYDEKGKASRFEGTVQDITERKIAEETIRLNEQQLNLIYNSISSLVMLVSVEGNNRFRFISLNKAALTAMKITSEEAGGKYLEEVLREPLLSEAKSKYNEAIETKSTVVWERIANYPDGKKIGIVTVTPVYDRQGNCIRLITSVNDITELKKIEYSLAISQQEYKSLFDQNPDAVYSLDLNGQFITFNQGLEKLLECNREDILNASSISNFFPPGYTGQAMDYLQKVHEGHPQSYEAKVITLKGNEKYISIINMPVVVNDVITGIYGIAKDITEQKLAELQLKELYDKLEERALQLQLSNTDLEQFAYVASHDLQEPLRMVSSFLQLLEKKYENSIDEKGHEYIRFAVDGSLRMKRLINDLLDYSRVSTRKQQLEPLDMNLVISDVLQNLSLQIAEKKAVVKTTVLPLLPAADKTQMLQLLQNLITNALKYSGTKQPVIEISATEKEDEWLFSVNDNGIGFDEKFAEKIFVIFHRLHNKNEYSGTGMGLAICKKIIDRHGGKIYAESVPDEGSTFWFTIKKQQIHN